MISALPSHYGFEIHKTVWRIRESGAKKVALQFPEGLLLFAPLIAEILEKSCSVACVLLGDVTYGACCVDDWAAKALGATFLVHYGHSCLISIKDSVLDNMMYVFVEIKVDIEHFITTVKALIPKEKRVVLGATIQFASCMRGSIKPLSEHFVVPPTVPQSRPLSTGEVLGCTSPKLDGGSHDCIVFVADGRFHMESLMIHNPTLKAYLYNPYTKLLTEESYDHSLMRKTRQLAIDTSRRCTRWGVVMGTLGHQGSPAVLARVQRILDLKKLPYTVVLLSEVFPAKLALFSDVQAWVQISCPRLSIDWGAQFATPLLSPFEFEVAMGSAVMPDVYPMDWYANGGGSWAVNTGKDLDENTIKTLSEIKDC
eukprot:TRINITY_DN5087_c0_g1_i1.p1 TRINITY_DN5087_c0_g1~~TRINITY_DN5087_c0_g1_i1.p1  ORF type:complete len:432 (+),score=52.61 TRINITY_DN5087_c0_g1_i1:192-1298(+)